MAIDPDAAPGFVAGFSQTNVGDKTPNTLGAWCDDGSSQMCSCTYSLAQLSLRFPLAFLEVLYSPASLRSRWW